MFELLKDKTIIGIIVTIILGAIGSGLWDIAIKPFFKIAARYILKFYTFGLERFRNPIYQRISQGKVDISISIYSILVLTFIFFPMLFIIAFISPVKREVIKQNQTLISHLEQVTKHEEKKPETKKTFFDTIFGFNEFKKSKIKYSEEIDFSLSKFNRIVHKYSQLDPPSTFSKDDQRTLVKLQSKIITATNGVEESWDKLFLRAMLAFGLLSLFTIIFLHYPVIRNIYINDSISYFEELLTICKPYMGQKSYDLLMSSFAQIKTKEDYIKIIHELKEIAQKNQIVTREFNIL